MKNFKITLIFLLIAIISNGQRIFDDVTFSTPQNVYAGQPVNEYKSLNERASQEYKRNKKFRNDLMDWILELKTKTEDEIFQTEMNNKYAVLLNMEATGNYQDMGAMLDLIKNRVLEEIDKCNTRATEAQKKAGGELRMTNNSSPKSKEDRLVELKNFYEKQLITKEEYEAGKKKVLSE